LIVCIRVSQLSPLLRTSTQPPTAAMSGRTKRATSSRTATRSTTTSESTETMISERDCKTARLIDRRLPRLCLLRRTRTRMGAAAATAWAWAKLSSVEQSSTTTISSLPAGYSRPSRLSIVRRMPSPSLNIGTTTVTVGW
jgi:hypothetical protein